MSKIKIEHDVPDSKLTDMNVFSWPTWECEPSTFNWEYTDDETCYVLEGDVIVKTGEEKVEIKPGDLVTFPRGLKCVWEVKKKIRKHYRMG
ncbi:cupin domain-containing protein [bacterium]|nr:cupin domain-containing protein [bacterium]